MTSWSTQAQLTIAGSALEVIGVALVSMDFWWPWFTETLERVKRGAGERASAALRHARRAWEWLVRVALRRKPPAARVSQVAMEVLIKNEGDATKERGKSNAALVRELGELNARVDRVEVGMAERHRALIESVQEMIRRSKDQYLGLRVVGLALALAGSILLAAANLVT
jgi:hypothetical protein